MFKFFMKLFDWINGGTDWRLERYLSQSADLADLERRQRQWQRMSDWERDRWMIWTRYPF